MDEQLQHIYQAITDIDAEIVQLLRRRIELLPALTKHRVTHQQNILDPQRDEVILQHVKQLAAQSGINPAFLEKLFVQIIEESNRIQTSIRDST